MESSPWSVGVSARSHQAVGVSDMLPGVLLAVGVPLLIGCAGACLVGGSTWWSRLLQLIAVALGGVLTGARVARRRPGLDGRTDGSRRGYAWMAFLVGWVVLGALSMDPLLIAVGRRLGFAI